MESTGKIYSALGAVMRTVCAVDKSKKNEQQGFMFRGIDDMMNALHNAFSLNGIILIPQELEHLQDTYQYTDGYGKTKVQFRSKIHMQYTFVSCDDGSSVTADGWGESADNGDKGYNKCKSIALKYILMQMFLVPTKDIADPDNTVPEDITAAAPVKAEPAKAKATEEDLMLELALQEIKECATLADLTDCAKRWSCYATNETFRNAGKAKQKTLTK